MRRLISILFLSLLLLQAIPVLHFFSSQKEIFYAYVDEEKPDDKVKEKLIAKEYLGSEIFTPPLLTKQNHFCFHLVKAYSSPHPERLTPPPNAC